MAVQTRRATGGEPGARIVHLSGSGDRCPVWGSLRGPGKRVGVGQRGATRFGEALMTRAAVSVRLIAGAPVALVDHARAERPGLDQVERDVFGDRRQERRAATDDDRIAEHAQLVDEAEL